MKPNFLLCALLLLSCSNKDAGGLAQTSADEAQIQQKIASFYAGLARSYNIGGVNTDSLIDAYFENDVRYVTPWGWTEPLDTTKARLRIAASHVKQFRHRIENVQIKSYGNAAYAFFILRQDYQVDGSHLEEYLPTTLVLERQDSDWKIVHVHRSTDFETIKQYVAMQQTRPDAK